MEGRGHQVNLSLGDDAQGALGAHHHARQVGRTLAHEVIQIVAANPAHDFGVAGLNLRKVLLSNALDTTVNVRLQAGTAELGFQLVAFQGTEVGLGTVGQYHVQLHDVVQGLAVNHRVGAAGVVADAPAHAGPVSRGGVGGVLQAVGEQVAVQLVKNNPRLHPHPLFLLVDLHHLVQVLAEVHHDGMVHRLSRQAGASGPGQYRHPRCPRATSITASTSSTLRGMTTPTGSI